LNIQEKWKDANKLLCAVDGGEPERRDDGINGSVGRI
jgi:hypothetical protein